MKAIFIQKYGDRNVLEYGHVSLPHVASKELLIQVMAAGVNPIDSKIRKGLLTHLVNDSFPMILGREGVGIVKKRGSSCKQYAIGDEVFFLQKPFLLGGYAEYIAVEEQYVALKPRTISYVEAACIPAAGLTALQAVVDMMTLEPAQTLLIYGASGGVGSFAIQLAQEIGAKIIAVASKQHFTYMQSLGATYVFDYNAPDFFSDLQQVSSPHGIDAILDMVGLPDCLLRLTTLLKSNGKMVSAVPSPQNVSLMREQGIAFHQIATRPNAAQLKILADKVDQGRLKPCLGKVCSLKAAALAHQWLEERHYAGKLVLEVNSHRP